jgi:hypothetical protein
LIITGEGINVFKAGWQNIYKSLYVSDAEVGQTIMWRNCDSFQKYPREECKPDLRTPRVYRAMSSNINFWPSLYSILTYHSISYSLSGKVYGYYGDNPITTIEIQLHQEHTENIDLLVDRTTASSDGSFSFVWYDQSLYLYTSAGTYSLSGRSPLRALS